MKILVTVARIIVGCLFIFSGFVKMIDPIGFGYKLQEYFEPDVLNLEFLSPYALMIAVFVVIFEVVLGVMLLIGYLKKFTLWSSLLMMAFFTLLTFYTAYFHKVTDCGCFGDAVKLTPWGTFWKDVALILLILLLFYGAKYIKPITSLKGMRILTFATFIGGMVLSYYVLMHLPIIDFRPFKIGANINEGMTIPPDAPKPVYEYKWKFNVNGEEKIITNTGEYPKVDGEFIGTETKLIKEGYEPPIHDFSIERDGNDYTQDFLNEKHLIIVVAYNLENTEKEGFINIKKITDQALEKGYKVIGMSATSTPETQAFTKEYNLNFKFYFCDETALKTIIRSNPGILELNNGTVVHKYHWNDALKLPLQKVN